MTSPSEHKEGSAGPSPRKRGLHCGAIRGGYVHTGPGIVGAVSHRHTCHELLLECDYWGNLGTRCYKSGCNEFHSLEALLRRAVEQNLLNPEQLEAIRKVVAEEPARKPEEEMTTKTIENTELTKIFSELAKIAVTHDVTHDASWGVERSQKLYGYNVTLAKQRGSQYHTAEITIPVYVVIGFEEKRMADLIGFGRGESVEEALKHALVNLLGRLELAKSGLSCSLELQ